MRVLITGGTGLVGKAIQTHLKDKTDNFKFLSSKCCDLTDLEKTRELFESFRPEFVIHLAAFVGGLYRNLNQKVDMFEKNILINFNVLKCCHEYEYPAYQLVFSPIKPNIL